MENTCLLQAPCLQSAALNKNTEPEEEQDAALEHRMAVIDAAVDADAAAANPLSGVLIPSWASQCNSTASREEAGTRDAVFVGYRRRVFETSVCPPVPYRQTHSRSRAADRSNPEPSGRTQSASSHVHTLSWRMPPHVPPAPLTGDEALLVPSVLTKLQTTHCNVHLMDPEKRAQYEHGIPRFTVVFS